MSPMSHPEKMSDGARLARSGLLVMLAKANAVNVRHSVHLERYLMRLPRWVLLLTTFGLLVASCAGNIDRGSKFGVEVGMPSAEAIAILERRGLQREPGTEKWLNADCGGRVRNPGETLDMFSRGPNQGPICLFTASGRVVAIAWNQHFRP
jgi:hypothetical protein